jgi:mycofactocin precursor
MAVPTDSRAATSALPDTQQLGVAEAEVLVEDVSIDGMCGVY